MYNLQGFYTDLKAKKIQLNCVLRAIKDLKFREIMRKQVEEGQTQREKVSITRFFHLLKNKITNP